MHTGEFDTSLETCFLEHEAALLVDGLLYPIISTSWLQFSESLNMKYINVRY